MRITSEFHLFSPTQEQPFPSHFWDCIQPAKDSSSIFQSNRREVGFRLLDNTVIFFSGHQATLRETATQLFDQHSNLESMALYSIIFVPWTKLAYAKDLGSKFKSSKGIFAAETHGVIYSQTKSKAWKHRLLPKAYT